MDVHHSPGQYGSVGIHGARTGGHNKRSAEFETLCMRKLMRQSLTISRAVLVRSEDTPSGYGYPELRFRRKTLYDADGDLIVSDDYPDREQEKKASKLALYFAGVRPPLSPPASP